MQVSVRLAALPIPEYLDFHSSYSAPRSRIAGIYSRIYSYSGIFPHERALNRALNNPALVTVLASLYCFLFTVESYIFLYLVKSSTKRLLVPFRLFGSLWYLEEGRGGGLWRDTCDTS